MNNNSSKQILLSVLGVAILVVAVVGVSFAAFTFSQQGTKENTITTGTVTLTYQEKSEAGISITDAMPTDDATGKTLQGENEYFDFNVDAKITGTTSIQYVVSAIKVTDGANSSTLQNEDVRLYLETLSADGQEASEPGTSKLEPKAYTPESEEDDPTATALGMTDAEMVLVKETVSTTQTDRYRLRMWLASTYGDTQGNGAFSEAKKFTVKINVYAKAV